MRDSECTCRGDWARSRVDVTHFKPFKGIPRVLPVKDIQKQVACVSRRAATRREAFCSRRGLMLKKKKNKIAILQINPVIWTASIGLYWRERCLVLPLVCVCNNSLCRRAHVCFRFVSSLVKKFNTQGFTRFTEQDQRTC